MTGGRLLPRLRLGRPPQTEITAEAVVFDCDGLLVDSESVWMDLISSWLPDRDGSPESKLESFRGVGVDDAAARLADLRHDGARPEDIQEQLVARYSALLAAGVFPMPGALDLVRTLAGDVPLAVASNGLRADVTAMLADIGILDQVQVIRTLDDVTSGKPAPDLYLEAASALGVDPSRTIAFEDSPAGARAARAAGMTVLGVNADPEVTLDCDLRVTALTELDVRLEVSGEKDGACGPVTTT